MFVEGQTVSFCPPSSIISPCSCNISTINQSGLAVNCTRSSLKDIKMSNILYNLLAPGVSPLTELYVGYNNLTKIPIQLSQFHWLVTIDLSWNQITSIPSGVFNLSNAAGISLDLSKNQIASIDPGTFSQGMI